MRKCTSERNLTVRECTRERNLAIRKCTRERNLTLLILRTGQRNKGDTIQHMGNPQNIQ
jgi:hypothetical protein